MCACSEGVCVCHDQGLRLVARKEPLASQRLAREVAWKRLSTQQNTGNLRRVAGKQGLSISLLQMPSVEIIAFTAKASTAQSLSEGAPGSNNCRHALVCEIDDLVCVCQNQGLRLFARKEPLVSQRLAREAVCKQLSKQQANSTGFDGRQRAANLTAR